MYLELNDTKYYLEINIIDIIKPTIVFLHDSLGCVRLWRDFPKRLAESCDCNYLIYDRQGYGESDAFNIKKREKNYLELEADILIQILDRLGIQSPILFGHSDGATISVIAAAKYLHKINAIICEGVHTFIEDISISGLIQAKNNALEQNLIDRLNKYHGDKSQAVFDIWINTWLNPEFRDWNILNIISNITCPVYIIQGEGDEFGSIEQVNSLKNRVKGEFYSSYLPSIGHSPHKEIPELILKKCMEFISNLII